MSRVDSVRIAVEKAQRRASTSTAARSPQTRSSRSPTGPQLAIDAGVRCVIQPGGSMRDPEVVEAADAAGISMVFTHRRHFKH